MTAALNAYLNFDGQTREAMEFYRSVLGGDLRVMTFGHMGETDPQLADKVMHSYLDAGDGMVLMGSDTPPGASVRRGNQVTLSLSGSDEERLRRLWDGLSEGGEITVPLEKQMWGDVFGQFTDRFGIAWMVDIFPKEQEGSADAS